MKIYNTPIKIKYIFSTLRKDRKYMFDELLKDGWRYNQENEIRGFIANCKLIKEFNIIHYKEIMDDETDVNNYFKKKYPKYKRGCSCNECTDDYELNSWSEILHG